MKDDSFSFFVVVDVYLKYVVFVLDGREVGISGEN